MVKQTNGRHRHARDGRLERLGPGRHAVALSFPDISTVVLAPMHAPKELGLKPEPER